MKQASILVMIYLLTACGGVDVVQPKKATVDPNETADTADTKDAPSDDPKTTTAQTPSKTTVDVQTETKVTVNGASVTAPEPPELAYEADKKNWIDAMTKVPDGYHIPTRAELVGLSDDGVFDAKSGAWWTATEAGHEQAWLYSPDSGFLGKNDKLLTAKIVYVKDVE